MSSSLGNSPTEYGFRLYFRRLSPPTRSWPNLYGLTPSLQVSDIEPADRVKFVQNIQCVSH